MIECSHPYIKKLAPGSGVCLECGAIVTKQSKVYDTSPLQMPPVIFELTPVYWEQVRPWPLISYELAKKYGWYVSMIQGRFYLVMPVLLKKVPVFYSARCLLAWNSLLGCPKEFKYTTPAGRARKMWSSGGRGKYKLYGEGIADAAYLSQLAPSRALLGSSWSVLDYAILVLDGDAKGIEAAFKIVQDARKRGMVNVKTVLLPPGKDPTDVPIEKLRKLIKEQTGVEL